MRTVLDRLKKLRQERDGAGFGKFMEYMEIHGQTTDWIWPGNRRTRLSHPLSHEFGIVHELFVWGGG